MSKLISLIETEIGKPALVESQYGQVNISASGAECMMGEVLQGIADLDSGEGDDGEMLGTIGDLLVSVANLYIAMGALCDPRDNAFPKPSDLLRESDL